MNVYEALNKFETDEVYAVDKNIGLGINFSYPQFYEEDDDPIPWNDFVERMNHLIDIDAKGRICKMNLVELLKKYKEYFRIGLFSKNPSNIAYAEELKMAYEGNVSDFQYERYNILLDVLLEKEGK